MTSIPAAIVRELEAHSGSIVKDFLPSAGGCINHGGRVDTAIDTFFLKWNDRSRFPGMFSEEARGLNLLREASPVKIPKVIYSGLADEFQFLLLEYIGEGIKTTKYWRDFGSGLALLHRNTSSHFGLDHHNYIGSLVQINTPSASWVDFFVQQRLAVQLKTARDQGRIDNSLAAKFGVLFGKLNSLLPDEPASLLHGDLWSGNLMTTYEGKPCLIDPAVYYGNREMDLAMTELFGGFDPSYYDSYEEVYPISTGFKERIQLYNLYPLLVHLNLFGGGYKAQVEAIVRRFL
jgi:protein-ribulosamine 3-kinase